MCGNFFLPTVGLFPILAQITFFLPQTPLFDPKMNRVTAPKMIGLIGLAPNFGIGLIGLATFQNDRVNRVKHRVDRVSIT